MFLTHTLLYAFYFDTLFAKKSGAMRL